ncbi:hypothetical protein [Pandoraea terrae]|uniref:hypothetical protein n=1 Tax=Pandoraea terrae TaxID=1537710 RepID=UPI001780054B|nr:hypothetical protein [Pandoraea terrae]
MASFDTAPAPPRVFTPNAPIITSPFGVLIRLTPGDDLPHQTRRLAGGGRLVDGRCRQGADYSADRPASRTENSYSDEAAMRKAGMIGSYCKIIAQAHYRSSIAWRRATLTPSST